MDRDSRHMAKAKSEFHRASGQLMSAIQKEWHGEAGLSTSAFSQAVMDRAHELQNASGIEQAHVLLSGMSVEQFLGELWVRRHPAVKQKWPTSRN